jgi:hypothetical protein
LNYIRKHLQVIKKFSRYLTESGQESFTVKLRKASNVKSILSREEIKSFMLPLMMMPWECGTGQYWLYITGAG